MSLTTFLFVDQKQVSMPADRSQRWKDRLVLLFTSRDRLSQRDFGLAIFLFSISVLFIGGLLAYVIVRSNLAQKHEPVNLVIPPALWISTVLLILGSISIQRAVYYVSHEKQQPFRNCLNLTFLLGGAFFVIQTIGLAHLLQQHSDILLSLEGTKNAANYPSSYGVLFTFVLVHAFHFFVAFGFLGFVIYKAYLYLYDHEYHWGVHACAVVWHFLGIIWICMLLLFYLIG
ncbi:cytochrome c oxidase subunit III [Gimesia maris DSM 8797]|nr:cytochrome c oxidase subunit III [Gimesia maris DSM 8797]HAW29656.1 heme-copper oxidase subunit III [Planctomycetaceae bacterium]